MQNNLTLCPTVGLLGLECGAGVSAGACDRTNNSTALVSLYTNLCYHKQTPKTRDVFSKGNKLPTIFYHIDIYILHLKI